MQKVVYILKMIPARKRFVIIWLAAMAVWISNAGASDHKVIIDDFEKGLGDRWRKQEFRGKSGTSYRVAKDGGNHILIAESRASASGLVYEQSYSLREYPILSWRWRVEKTLKKGDETRKEGDDYAARVYVIFPHWIPFRTKSINYIWANRLTRGKSVPNSYYSNAVMYAVESGDDNAGRWMTERRNVYEDFKAIFGHEPPDVGAIAVMTDTDNTGEEVTAYYDNIIIEKAPPEK